MGKFLLNIPNIYWTIIGQYYRNTMIKTDTFLSLIKVPYPYLLRVCNPSPFHYTLLPGPKVSDLVTRLLEVVPLTKVGISRERIVCMLVGHQVEICRVKKIKEIVLELMGVKNDLDQS